MREWIGFDLDGTLAVYSGWKLSEKIGSPILPMVELAKDFMAKGIIVKIFTARVSSNNPHREHSLKLINEWSRKVFGEELPVTSEKDYMMIDLYDDRCHRVEFNTGKILN